MTATTTTAQGHTTQQPLFITMSQAAEIAGVSRPTIGRMCQDGTIAAVKLRGCWRINRAAFMQMVGLE